MKQWWKKYVGLGVMILVLSIIFIAVLFCFLKFQVIAAGLRKLYHALASVIIGLVIAYVLAPIYNWLTEHIAWLLRDKLHWKGRHLGTTVLVLAMTATFVLALGVVIGLIAMLIPRLVESVTNVINYLPRSTEDITVQFQYFLGQYVDMNSGPAPEIYEQAMGYAQNWVNNWLLPYMSDAVSVVSMGILDAVQFAKNVFIGLIVAVYILANKRTYIKAGTRLIYSVTGARVGNIVMDNIRFINKMFSGFIGGKIIDSFIIGLICGVVLSIMDIPYAVLISVIVGITNIIPFFGPFIGAIPCSILLVLVQPIAALKFLIFIFLLQQFDGNILGPKILGNSTGVSSFGVLFSILLFGGLFGFVGMIIGVPVFAVIMHFIETLTSIGLRRHALPEDVDAYERLDYMDEHTRQPVRRQTVHKNWAQSPLHSEPPEAAADAQDETDAPQTDEELSGGESD